jgi:hypothetical protein
VPALSVPLNETPARFESALLPPCSAFVVIA